MLKAILPKFLILSFFAHRRMFIPLCLVSFSNKSTPSLTTLPARITNVVDTFINFAPRSRSTCNITIGRTRSIANHCKHAANVFTELNTLFSFPLVFVNCNAYIYCLCIVTSMIAFKKMDKKLK